MKHLNKKTNGLLAFIAVLIATPLFAAQAQEYNYYDSQNESANLQTSRRPDVAFVITNNTNKVITFRGQTDCADFPPMFKVQPRQQKFIIWGEAMDHGTCALLAKDIQLRADGYNFLIDAAAEASNPIFKPTLNEEWEYSVKGDGKISVNHDYYSSRDLYIEMTVNQ